MSRAIGPVPHLTGRGLCVPGGKSGERNHRLFLKHECCPMFKMRYSIHEIATHSERMLASAALVTSLM